LSDLPLLVLPTAGRADAATLTAVEDLHPAAILLSDVSTKQTRPLLQGNSKTQIVNISASATGGGPGPDPRNTPVHLQQRMLAETWLEASTAPPDSTLGRVRLVTSPAQAQGEDTCQRAVDQARDAEPALLHPPPGQRLNYSKAARAAELNANQLHAIQRLGEDWNTYTDLLAYPGATKVTAGAALARASSSRWRRAEGAMRAFLAPQQASLDQNLRDSIEISANPKVTTVARQGVGFPITVRNLLRRNGPEHQRSGSARSESDNALRRPTPRSTSASYLREGTTRARPRSAPRPTEPYGSWRS
jgi:hypothetical protein